MHAGLLTDSIDKRLSISDELGEGVQEYLRMLRLTQRKAGRSDNNEADGTPLFDASMAGRIGSMFEHWPERLPSDARPSVI